MSGLGGVIHDAVSFLFSRLLCMSLRGGSVLYCPGRSLQVLLVLRRTGAAAQESFPSIIETGQQVVMEGNLLQLCEEIKPLLGLYHLVGDVFGPGEVN